MCGIHVIVDKNNRLNETVIERMLKAMHHRGPDTARYFRIQSPRQTVWIASNRLKISDLRDEANQPMQPADGRYTLAFNGALYNDRQLRAQKLSSVNFQTTSDTETTLHLLIQGGHQALDELNGMFALAFYDQVTETLLLARDRWGMKPLYYVENSSFLIASSEIRGILASGLVSKEPDLEQVPHYLTFKFARRPATFYRNIQEMEPGSGLVSLPGEELKAIRYSAESPGATSGRGGFGLFADTILPEATLLDTLDEAISRTVGRYCQADVPAGLFLSGGVDSTLLLACAHEQKLTLPVFTIGYPESDNRYTTQDQAFARRAVRQYGAELHEVKTDATLLERFPEWIATIDQPVADGAAWLTYLLAQEAKKHVTIVLSGAGADELFAGYNRHWAFGQYLNYHLFLRRFLSAGQNTISANVQTPGSLLDKSYFGRLFRKGFAQLHASPEQTFTRFTAGATAFPWLGKLALQESYSLQPTPAQNMFRESHLRAALEFDQSHYLASDVLAITDRMTMQHGIEVRLPYLDTSIAALAGGVPAEYLLKHGRKWLLKKILSRKNGKAYVQRRKEGFGMPMGHWLHAPAATAVLVPLQKRTSLIYNVLDYSFVQSMLAAHRNRRADFTAELWALALLAAWFENEF